MATPTFWTLEYIAPNTVAPGIEKALADNGDGISFWGKSKGIASMTIRYTSQDIDTCSFRMAGSNFDDDDLFAFTGTCIIRKQRILNPDGSFSGGTGMFYGRVNQTPRTATGRRESASYQLVGPYWYLMNRTYEFAYQVFSGYVNPSDPTQGITTVTKTSPHVFLNLTYETIGGNTGYARLCTGEMIQLAVDWSVSKGAPIQLLGNINVPINNGAGALYDRTVSVSAGIKTYTDVAIDEVNALTCGEVVLKQIRWNPDIVTWFDYTTTPYPTFYCMRRQYLATKNVNLTDGGADGLKKKVINLTSREDLSRPFVRIIFETSNNNNGFQWFDTVDQVWPDPIPTETSSAFGGLVATVTLGGVNLTTTAAKIQTMSLPTAGAPTQAAYDYLFLKNKSLKPNDGTPDDTSTIKSITINKVIRNGSLGFELFQGPIPSWVAATQSREKIVFNVTTTLKDNTNSSPTTTPTKETRDYSSEIVTTTLDTGGQSLIYLNNSGFSTPELPPPTVAKDLYDAINLLQHSGEIEISEQESSGEQWMGNVLTCSDTPKFSNIYTPVQDVSIDVFSGSTKIRIGPSKLLSAGEYVDLLKVVRYRIKSSPTSNLNANLDQTANTNVQLGKDHPIDNSASGPGVHSSKNFTDDPMGNGLGNNVTISTAGNPQIVMVNNATPTPTTPAKITLSLQDANGKVLKIQEWDVCVPDGSGNLVKKKALFLSSTAY